jgi:hypothetical protein
MLGVVVLEKRVPLTLKRIKIVGTRKRKTTAVKKTTTGGTKFGHYANFIKTNYE